MLRSRDIVAVLFAVWLMRLASQESQTLNASLHLAFYTHATVHAPFDVDGDGTIEALAIVSTKDKARTLEILDLKPLHGGALSDTAPPFRPKTMLSASLEGASMPLKITTGQIMISHTGDGTTKPKKVAPAPGAKVDADFTDRTKHYFCGDDWHHASQQCTTPCPGGTPGECPGDEKCYADTPCDALKNMEAASTKEKPKSNYQLTPAGGLPSVVTLFADGTITLHSVTVDHANTADYANKELDLVQLWSHKIALSAGELYDVLLMGDVDLSTESGMDGHYGVVLVGGTQQPSSIITALDVMTGTVLWTTSSDDIDEPASALVASRGTSSTARRRSKLVSAGESNAKHDIALPNCWTAYRHALFLDQTVKPYWGAADNKWSPVHLDRSRKQKHRRQEQQKPGKAGDHKNSGKHKQHRFKKQHDRQWHHRHAALNKPLQGRPNALLQRHKGGIQVRSLKNGRSLCHLSLLDQVVYTDLNHDGTLDQISAVTSVEGIDADQEHMEWIMSLGKQVSQEKSNQGGGRPRRSTHLCHLLALSGLPAREQLYYSSLCPNVRDDPELSSAPPLLLHNGMGRDQQLVVALSNGLTSKHDARTGNRIWQHHGDYKDVPTWDRNSNAASVTLLYPNNEVNKSPILTTGENSMTLLTQKRGKVLATTAFPQTTKSRPLVQDWSGDGTPDVLLQTPDAVWGYRILCQQSRTSSRLLVGLLLVGIALALLRNRFVNSDGGDKRSTDR